MVEGEIDGGDRGHAVPDRVVELLGLAGNEVRCAYVWVCAFAGWDNITHMFSDSCRQRPQECVDIFATTIPIRELALGEHVMDAWLQTGGYIIFANVHLLPDFSTTC